MTLMLLLMMRICGITKSYVKAFLDFSISYLGGFRDRCTTEFKHGYIVPSS